MSAPTVSKYASRKLLFGILCIVSILLMVRNAALDPEHAMWGIISLFGTYCGANVTDKFTKMRGKPAAPAPAQS